MERSRDGLMDIIFRHFLDETETNHENPGSGWPVFWLKLELKTADTHVERYHYHLLATCAMLEATCSPKRRLAFNG
jgi:hypothetical protein